LGAWRSASQGLRTRYTYEKQSYQITLIPAGEGEWSVQIDENEPVRLTCIFAEQHQVVLRRGQKLQRVTVIRQPEAMFVSIEGRVLRLERRQALSVDLVAHSGTGIEMQKALTAPMAGTIVKVQVQDGSEVAARQVLVILSAMKMEHTVIAPHAGRVRRVHYKEGDVVKGGAVLVEMEETGN
jgi:3-methylcrotonyl-CoA carboxylase alpha subunit